MRNVSDKSCRENQNTHFVQKYINNQQMRFNICGVFYSQYSHPVVVNCVFLIIMDVLVTGIHIFILVIRTSR
jgi:hypothetical protein